MLDISLDIETLSLAQNATVISIGAVAFDRTQILAGFYANIVGTAEYQTNMLNRHIDQGTLDWWNQQTPEAKKVFDPNQIHIIDSIPDYAHIRNNTLENALSKFVLWCRNYPKARVWGLGSDFDNVVMRSLYNDMNMEQPWTHKQNACLRTLLHLFPLKEKPMFGIEHNAIDDAVAQAFSIQKIHEEYKL